MILRSELFIDILKKALKIQPNTIEGKYLAFETHEIFERKTEVDESYFCANHKEKRGEARQGKSPYSVC